MDEYPEKEVQGFSVKYNVLKFRGTSLKINYARSSFIAK